MMEFYSEKKVKAAKEHVCELCQKKIKPGERYYRESGKYEGEFFSRALHIQCHFMEVDYCYNVNNEFAWYDIIEDSEDIYCSECETECCYSVTNCPKIRSVLCEKYKDMGETM